MLPTARLGMAEYGSALRRLRLRAKDVVFTSDFARSWFRRVYSHPLTARMAGGAFWSLCGAVSARALGLVTSVLVARALGTEMFGELGIIQSTIGMFGTFAGFGAGLTATKYIGELRVTHPVRTGRVLGICGMTAFVTGTIFTLVMLAGAPWLATRTLANPQLAGLLRIGSMLLLFGALNGAQTGALIGFAAFKTVAKLNFISGVANLPLLVGGVYLDGLRGATIAMVVSTLLSWLLNNVALRRECRRANVPFTFKGAWCESAIIAKFNLPATLSSVMVGPVNWACAALLVNSHDGYAQLGVYNVANQWRLAILFVPGAVSQVVLPLLASEASGDNPGAYFSVLKLSLLVNVAAALLVAAPVAAFSGALMHMYGDSFAQGTVVLAALAFSAVLTAANNVVGQAIASKSRMWMGTFLNAVWAGTLLFFTFVFVQSGFGAMGLALATVISYVVHSLMQALFFKSIIARR